MVGESSLKELGDRAREAGLVWSKAVAAAERALDAYAEAHYAAQAAREAAEARRVAARAPMSKEEEALRKAFRR